MDKAEIASGKEKESHTPASFWQWFSANQHRFLQLEEMEVDQAHEKVNEVVEELKKYDSWFKALMGKYDDTTSELIITADGDIALFVKVEEFVKAAPNLPGWRFTAHKPPQGFDEISVEMYGKIFDDQSVKFYPVIDPAYPDLVSVVFTHSDYNEEEAEDFQTAGTIYVQNAMGELNTAIQLDSYDIGPEPAEKSELIPVTKLNDYLTWRQKEFVEKYDATTIDFPEINYTTIEGEDEDGNIMMAIAVSSFEDWTYKPVYCWWVGVLMEFEGTENGLPDEPTFKLLHDTEDRITNLLCAHPETIYVASKTFKGTRMANFYARDYKTPSYLLIPFCEQYDGKLKLSFFIEKDKYWQRVDEFYGLDEADLVDEDDEEDEEQS